MSYNSHHLHLALSPPHLTACIGPPPTGPPKQPDWNDDVDTAFSGSFHCCDRISSTSITVASKDLRQEQKLITQLRALLRNPALNPYPSTNSKAITSRPTPSPPNKMSIPNEALQKVSNAYV